LPMNRMAAMPNSTNGFNSCHTSFVPTYGKS